MVHGVDGVEDVLLEHPDPLNEVPLVRDERDQTTEQTSWAAIGS